MYISRDTNEKDGMPTTSKLISNTTNKYNLPIPVSAPAIYSNLAFRKLICLLNENDPTGVLFLIVIAPKSQIIATLCYQSRLYLANGTTAVPRTATGTA